MSTKRKKKKEETETVEDRETAAAGDEQSEQAVRKKETDAAQIDQELAELKERLQRLSADYQNYQKRSFRQIEQARQLAKEEMAKGLLAVLDNFEHALEKGQQAQNVAAVQEGVRIVYDHLLKVLGSEGLERIEVEAGMSFDPNLHEAMLHEPSSEYEDNTILRELTAGYMMNDRTLRPAKVSVAKAVTQPVTDKTDDPSREAEPVEQIEPDQTEENEQE